MTRQLRRRQSRLARRTSGRRQIYLVQREMPQRRWRYWGWVDAV